MFMTHFFLDCHYVPTQVCTCISNLVVTKKDILDEMDHSAMMLKGWGDVDDGWGGFGI